MEENLLKEQINVRISPRLLRYVDLFQVQNRKRFITRSILIEKALIEFLGRRGTKFETKKNYKKD